MHANIHTERQRFEIHAQFTLVAQSILHTPEQRGHRSVGVQRLQRNAKVGMVLDLQCGTERLRFGRDAL